MVDIHHEETLGPAYNILWIPYDGLLTLRANASKRTELSELGLACLGDLGGVTHAMYQGPRLFTGIG